MTFVLSSPLWKNGLCTVRSRRGAGGGRGRTTTTGVGSETDKTVKSMNMQYAICYSKFKERSYSIRMQNYCLIIKQ